MNMFNHVIDSRVRSVLNGSYDEDSICYALTHTASCLAKDMTDEEIDLTVLDARIEAFNEACEWWNDEGVAYRCVEALQRCWGV